MDEQEIINIVNNNKGKASLDYNNISMALVKRTIYDISKPLTFICNLSFSTGCFPDRMKTAKVVPLFKNGERNIFTNYRPVSLLCQFSNILEKLFAIRLDTFINFNNILSNSQYGFS